MKIYLDGTIQYIYSKLYQKTGEEYKGSSNGETLQGASLSVIEYKVNSVVYELPVITWNDAIERWIITVTSDMITQCGGMFVIIESSTIKTIIEVLVDIAENNVVTTDAFSQLATSLENDILNLGTEVESIVSSGVVTAMNDYEVVSTTDLDEQLTNHIQEIMNLEIKTGLTFKEFLRFIDIIYSGVVTNAGSGTVTFTGTDGSTVYIMGDNLGNRSDVIVNLL